MDTPRVDEAAVGGELRPGLSERSYRIFVIHHTHWDREWWATYQDFRVRLVELIDELLATLDRDLGFRTFLLDGQTIVLEDYLDVRPENEAKLVRYIREGRIQCGPWYVLSDEFLVSAEAIVRNLWLGRLVARRLGCPILDVGYLPDTFGHIGQMPQILHGFDIDSACVWRGRGGDPETVKQEFRWEAPDGSSVLTHWFPDGYYQMPFLHFDNPDRPFEDRVGRIFSSIARWGPRATTDALLMPYGGDHRSIDPRLAAKIEQANAAIAGLGSLRWATIDEYIQAVKERAPFLQVVHGELRQLGPETPHLLSGVLSTRLYLKQLNCRAQTWLERYAEPFAALAWWRGGRYDAGLLWKGWQLLVQNHPHDSICGCSIDQVHREMVPRFDQAIQLAQISAEKSMREVGVRIDTSGMGPDDRALVVHNSLPRIRSGWVGVWLARDTIDPGSHRLLDDAGREIPFQTRDVEGSRPMTDRYRFSEIGFVADCVPGLGYRTFRLAPRVSEAAGTDAPVAGRQSAALRPSETGADTLLVGENVLENGFLRVEVSSRDGTLSVLDKLSGHVYHGLNTFEDGGDAGDAYNYSAPRNDAVLRSYDGARVRISVAEAGAARATLRVDLEWALPAELTSDRLNRSTTYLSMRLASFVTLSAGARHLEVASEWPEHPRDHRLRALFPLGEPVHGSFAQGHFDVAQRPISADCGGDGWPETNPRTMPQQGWVAVEASERSLMIANRGLPEYEVLRDERGTIALTIMRAVGWLSRDDLLSRHGGAGPSTPTPDAQCPGFTRVEYAIIPYAGSWQDAHANRVAEEYLIPLQGVETDRHAGDLPASAGTAELLGDHCLEMSACKRTETGDALLLRFWNTCTEPSRAGLRVDPQPRRVEVVDLAEEPTAQHGVTPGEGGVYDLQVRGSAIISIAVYC